MAFGLGLLPAFLGLRHGFYADDFFWLEEAQYSLGTLSHLVSIWAAGFFRPLAQILFFLEFLVFRFHSFGYNLVGVALHAAVGLCLWQLAVSMGFSQRQRAWTVLFFLVGAGHFTKPVAWACSHAILLGAVFTLLAVRRVLLAPSSSGNSRQLLVAFLLALLAMLTHDLYALLPVAMGIFVALLRHPGWRRYFLASLSLTALYLWVSLQAHSTIELEHGRGLHMLTNLAQYTASLLGPFISLPVLKNALSAAGLPATVQFVAWIFVLAVGTITFAAILLQSRRLGRAGLGILVLALGLLLPALSIVREDGWINARYVYPSAALFCMLLSGSLDTLFRRRGMWMGLVVSLLWYLSLLSGSAYMQRKAVHAGAAPGVRQEIERIRGLTTREEGGAEGQRALCGGSTGESSPNRL
jgi:hypothetical protein